MFKIGIIGGTGLENPNFLKNSKNVLIKTPFGNHSDILEGFIDNVPCVLLSRHGKLHQFSPSNINYRANIWALNKLGVSIIIASSASGSLKEEIKPGDIVFLDSFIDRTTQRIQTFYNGKNYMQGVCHIPSHPLFNEKLKSILINCAKELNFSYHIKGTSVCIEGPRYSTFAESNLYRNWGANVVNMTVCPEAILSKELGIPYVSISLITDYDCWRDNHESVSVNLVDKVLKENSNKILQLLSNAVKKLNLMKNEFFNEIYTAKKIANESIMGFKEIDDL